MKLDENFEPTSDDYALPDRLLERVEKLWKGLKRVVVEKKEKKSWKKVNGFALAAAAQGEPDDQPEHVAAMIVAIAAYNVEEEGEEGTYRARFLREINGKEEKPTFSFRQKLGGETGDVMDPSDADMATMIGTVLNAQIAFIGIQNTHIENQNGRILELSNASTKQIEQLLKTNETLVAQYHQGLAMQANSLSILLDRDRELEADRQKGKNTEKLLDILKVAAPVAFAQFGSYLKAKAGIETNDEDEDEAETGEEGSDSASKKEEEDSASKERKTLQENLRKRPLTTFAHAFKDSITTDQWFDLAQVLSKKQIQALKLACYAEKDEETAEAILVFRELLLKNATKLAELGTVLEERQMQMILRLNEKAEEYDKGKSEKN
jgi:hypothetical protein